MANERGADTPPPESTPPGSGNPSSRETPNNINQAGRGLGATDQELDRLAEQLGIPQDRRGGFHQLIRSLAGNRMEATPERPTPTPREGGPELDDPTDVNFARPDIQAEQQRRTAEMARERGYTPDQIRQLQQMSEQGAGGEQSFYNMYQELEHYKNTGDFHRIRERVDNILATLDIDEAGDAPGINEMLQYMNIVFAEPKYEAFRSEITNWIEARQITHSVAFAAKYLKCEQWGSGTTNIRGRHLKALMTGQAEKKASAILEESAEIRDVSGKVIGRGAAGEHYRRKAGETSLKEEKLEQILGNWGGDNGQYKPTSADNPWTLLQKYKLVDEMWSDHGGTGSAKDFLGIDGAAKLAGLKDFPQKRDFYDENGGFKEDVYKNALETYCTENKDQIQRAADLAKEKYRKLFLYGMNKMIDSDPLDKNYSAYRAVNMLYNDQEKGEDPNKAGLFTDLEGKKMVSEATRKALEAKQQLIETGNGTALTDAQIEDLAKLNKLTDEEIKQLKSLDLDQVSEATLGDVEKAFVQLNRAFVIAEKIHHASGYSAISDGLVWKEDAKIPPELRGSAELGYLNVAGQSIVVDPIIEWDDDETRPVDPSTGNKLIGTGEKVTIHLAVDMLPISDDDSDEVKRRKRVLKRLATEKSGEIAKAWSNAYRKLYVEHSDQINYANSKAGRGARDKKKLHYKPADYWDPGELNNGKFTELRKYGYVNTLTTQQFFGLGSNEQLAVGWDPFFNRIKYNVSRWGAMEKLQSMFDKAGPRLLYDTHSIQSPEHLAKTLEDFMKASFALTEMVEFEGDHQAAETEVTEYIQTLAKGLLEFRTNDHIAEKYHLEKLNYNEIDQMTRMLAFKHLAGHHDVDELRAAKLGVGVDYLIRSSWHSVDKKKGIWGALLGFMQEFSKQFGSATDFSKAA